MEFEGGLHPATFLVQATLVILERWASSMHPPPLLPPQSLPGPWRGCRRTAMIRLSWRSLLLAMRAPPRTGDGPGRLRRLQAALAPGPFTKDRNDIANGFRNYGSRLQNLFGEGLISAVVNVVNSRGSVFQTCCRQDQFLRGPLRR